MKKFSTAGTVLALALFATTAPVSAHSGPKSSQCEFLATAPDSHEVVRGDTLWDISGRFLQNPWCWPTVWDMNREDIKNPHWIYPGQIIYFDRAAGRLGLSKPGSDGSGMATVKLRPGMRASKLEDGAISSIPPHVIEPFLVQPLIVKEHELEDSPRIVAGKDGRVFFSSGEKVYVRGKLENETMFQAFRPGRPLRDPVDGNVIGYEAAYLGTLRLEKKSEFRDVAHTFIIETTKEEMGAGDHLVPLPPTPLINYVPHPPSQQVYAHVVAIYGPGLQVAGPYQVVSINRGEKHGIDVGTVLELHRKGRVIADKTNDGKAVKLPDEKYGSLFVFRTFESISYGLIMQVNDAVQIGDMALSPIASR